MKKTLVSIVVVVLAVVAAIVLLPRLLAQHPTPGPASEPSPPGAAPDGVHIKTVVVHASLVSTAIRLSGQVNPTEQGRADVTVPLQGVVVSPLVKVGQKVAQGLPVATINSVYGQTGFQMLQKIEADQGALVQAQTSLSQAQNALGSAQATVASARTTLSQSIDNGREARSELARSRLELQRKKNLLAGGVAAQTDVDDARERFERAQAADEDTHNVVQFSRRGLQVAESNLQPLQDTIRLARNSEELASAALQRDRAVYGQAELMGANLPQELTPVRLDGPQPGGGQAAAATEFYVRCPITGTVSNVAMSAGLSVSPGTIIATIVDTRQVYVDGNGFESDLPSLHVGDAVTVSAPEFASRTFHGDVRSVAPVVDPTNRTMAVRSLISNPDSILRLGMFVNVRITPKQARHALMVPDKAVMLAGEKRYAYVQGPDGKLVKREVVVGASVPGQVEIVHGLAEGDTVVSEGTLLLDAQSQP